MGLSENKAAYGHRLRVYRKIGDDVFDEVFYLTKNNKPLSKKDQKSVWNKAKKRDKELSESQQEARIQERKINPVKFNSVGKIVGLNIGVTKSKTSKSSNVDQFKARIHDRDGGIIYTQVSITYHGIDKAYDIMVNKFAKVLGLSKKSKLYSKMLAAKAYYVKSQKKKKTQKRKKPVAQSTKKIITKKVITKKAPIKKKVAIKKTKPKPKVKAKTVTKVKSKVKPKTKSKLKKKK